MIINWTKKILNDNPYIRKTSTYEIKNIVEKLGKDIAKKDFINILNLYLHEEDEIIVENFINEFNYILLIAKANDLIPKYIPTLEKLCFMDSKYVKEKTCEYLCSIMLENNFENKEEQFISLIKKLSISNNQNSKICASYLSIKLFESYIIRF